MRKEEKLRMSPNRKAWKQGSFLMALAARGCQARIPLLLLLALVMGAASPAPAAQVSFVSISGIWHDPVDNLPGSQPGDPVITNGTPTSSISWGQTSGTPQSGYDFTAVLPPPITFPGPILFVRDVYASELLGQQSFVDVSSARRRPCAQRGRRPNRSIDLHVYVQPRGNPEQPDALSLSDTARGGVHGPGDHRLLRPARDVQRRRSGLHVRI